MPKSSVSYKVRCTHAGQPLPLINKSSRLRGVIVEALAQHSTLSSYHTERIFKYDTRTSISIVFFNISQIIVKCLEMKSNCLPTSFKSVSLACENGFLRGGAKYGRVRGVLKWLHIKAILFQLSFRISTCLKCVFGCFGDRLQMLRGLDVHFPCGNGFINPVSVSQQDPADIKKEARVLGS